MTARTASRRLVQKYGGTSVGTPARLRRVAQRAADARRTVDGLVVVVSAMGDTTDRLLALARRVSAVRSSREMDMLLSTGETVTAPLLAMALAELEVPAVSLTGPQAGIRTTRSHRRARIEDIVPQRILEALDNGQVAVVAGFQGVTDSLDITTLGRGGSDTTAVALAVALGAERCEIYTDVRGVFTADPRVVADARPLADISYDEMVEFAAVGARVMHPRAVEIGAAYSMPIVVRSSFDAGPGTLICREPQMENTKRVRGIAHEIDVAKVTLVGVPDRPGIAAAIFGPLGEAQVNVDIIVQNVGHGGSTDLSFTLAESDLARALPIVRTAGDTVGAAAVETSTDIAKVSVVGTGLANTPGMFATMFGALADRGINVQMISTSEIHLTCIIDRGHVEDAVRALHVAYALDVL